MKRCFIENRILLREKSYFCLKFHSHEETLETNCLPVGPGFTLQFMCFVKVVASDAQGRAADGKDGKAVEETI